MMIMWQSFNDNSSSIADLLLINKQTNNEKKQWKKNYKTNKQLNIQTDKHYFFYADDHMIKNWWRDDHKISADILQMIIN